MRDRSLPFQPPPALITLFALGLVGSVMLALLLILVGYNGQRLGLLLISGLLAAGAGVAILWQPQLGAYVLVVTICTNMSTVFTDQGLPSITKPLVALIFAGLLLNRLFTRRPLPRFGWVEWSMLAYGCVWVASGFVARHQWIVMSLITDFGKDFLILVCIVAALEEPRHWRRALWLALWAVTALAALGSYQVLTGNYGQTFYGFAGNSNEQVLSGVLGYRLIGPLSDPNFYGLILSAVFPLAIYRFLDESRLLYRLAAAGAALLILFAIVNTYSRGALVILFVCALFLLWERRVRPASLVLIGLAGLLLWLIMPASYSERLRGVTDVLSGDANVRDESSLRGRASEFISGLMMFADHPVLGVGVGNFSSEYQTYASELGLEYRAKPREAHSLYVETLAETGLIGISALGLLFGGLLLRLNQIRRHLRPRDPRAAIWITSLLLCILAYLTGSIFLHGDYIRYLWLLVSLAAAAIHLYPLPGQEHRSAGEIHARTAS